MQKSHCKLDWYMAGVGK